MSEISLVNSMNQSIINKITEFKNKEIKKDELNKYMLLNLCHILKNINKMKSKNEDIQKQQEVEIKKSLSTIKSYHGDINYNPIELESNPIMKKVVNPTFESYIPISKISYSTEIQFYKKNSDICNFNESLLFKKKENKELENEEKEIDFEEPPIILLTRKKSIKLKNSLISKNIQDDDILDLIKKDDEELFINEQNDNQNKDLLFLDLINSFDEENKEDLINEDIDLDFKKIESLFYLDDIFLNQRTSKRNSSGFYNNFSTNSGSTSFGSRKSSYENKAIINKETYEDEFQNFMSFESFNKYCERMSIDYLRYMLVIYSNAINISKKCYLCEDKMFISIMKKFILKIGICSKKIYDTIVNSLLSKKKTISNFENFLKSFSTILKLKDDNSILKYKFIISLFRFNDEDINFKHINIFLKLIGGKMIFEPDIFDEISHGLVKRYDKIYCDDLGTNFKFGNILICLETFFDKKTTY